MHCLIIAADGARARLISYEGRQGGPRGTHLVERADLVNPAHDERAGQRYTGSRRGSRSHRLGHFYTVDDHREKHDRETARRFAEAIIREASRLAREVSARKLVIAADPHMLGILRKAHQEAGGDLPADEIPSELSKLSLTALEDHLGNLGVLPVAHR